MSVKGEKKSSKPGRNILSNPVFLHDFSGTCQALFLVIALVVTVFWSTVFFDFVNYDDIILIKNNPLIQSLAPDNVARIFSCFFTESYYPVRLLSFAVDYRVWGENPGGYHFSNLVIHVSNVILIFWLFLRIWKSESRQPGLWGAFAGAAFFGAHPVVAGTVAWIPGREELLMLFFGLLCLHCLLVNNKTTKNRLLWRVLAACFCVFSCLSNVMGAAFAVVAALYYFCFYGFNIKIVQRTWYLWVIGAFAVFLKFLGFLAWDPETRCMTYPYIFTAISHLPELLCGFAAHGKAAFDPVARVSAVFTAFGADVLYVLCPVSMPVFYERPIAVGFWSFSLVLGFIVSGFCVVALFFARGKKILLFGLAWFFVTLLSTAQIIPNEIWRADRFLYMPLAGLAIAVGWLVAAVWNEKKIKTAVVFGLVLVALALQSVLHVGVFADGLKLHKYAVAKSPDFYLVHENLAEEYRRLQMYGPALDHFRKAISLAPNKNYLWAPVMQILRDTQNLDMAESMGRKAVLEQPDNPYRHNYLATVLSLRGKTDEAVIHFKKAIELDPDGCVPYHNLGLTLMGQKRAAQAIIYLQKALELSPENNFVRLDLARAYEAADQAKRGAKHYQ